MRGLKPYLNRTDCGAFCVRFQWPDFVTRSLAALASTQQTKIWAGFLPREEEFRELVSAAAAAVGLMGVRRFARSISAPLHTANTSPAAK